MRSSVQTRLSTKQRAFTIIEIMIAIAVIGSLVAIALPREALNKPPQSLATRVS